MPTRPATLRAARAPTLAAPTRLAPRERGYTSEWDSYSVWFRRQPENLWCACGCRRRSKHVDHIIAVPPSDPRFRDMANHQALAKVCHDAKTARFNGGGGRAPDTSAAGRAALGFMLAAAAERKAKIETRLARAGGGLFSWELAAPERGPSAHE